MAPEPAAFQQAMRSARRIARSLHCAICDAQARQLWRTRVCSHVMCMRCAQDAKRRAKCVAHLCAAPLQPSDMQLDAAASDVAHAFWPLFRAVCNLDARHVWTTLRVRADRVRKCPVTLRVRQSSPPVCATLPLRVRPAHRHCLLRLRVRSPDRSRARGARVMLRLRVRQMVVGGVRRVAREDRLAPVWRREDSLELLPYPSVVTGESGAVAGDGGGDDDDEARTQTMPVAESGQVLKLGVKVAAKKVEKIEVDGGHASLSRSARKASGHCGKYEVGVCMDTPSVICKRPAVKRLDEVCVVDTAKKRLSPISPVQRVYKEVWRRKVDDEQIGQFGVCIALDGYDKLKYELLVELVGHLGGEPVNELGGRVTARVLICAVDGESGRLIHRNVLVHEAITKRVPVVGANWLAACFQAGQWLDTVPFIATGT